MRTIEDSQDSEVEDESSVVYNPRGPVDQHSCEIRCLSEKLASDLGIRESKESCRKECAKQFQ